MTNNDGGTDDVIVGIMTAVLGFSVTIGIGLATFFRSVTNTGIPRIYVVIALVSMFLSLIFGMLFFSRYLGLRNDEKFELSDPGIRITVGLSWLAFLIGLVVLGGAFVVFSRAPPPQ